MSASPKHGYPLRKKQPEQTDEPKASGLEPNLVPLETVHTANEEQSKKSKRKVHGERKKEKKKMKRLTAEDEATLSEIATQYQISSFYLPFNLIHLKAKTGSDFNRPTIFTNQDMVEQCLVQLIEG